MTEFKGWLAAMASCISPAANQWTKGGARTPLSATLPTVLLSATLPTVLSCGFFRPFHKCLLKGG